MSTSPENLRQVASMRRLLECHALKESFQAGDMEWEGRVVAAHHKLAQIEKRMVTGDRSNAETLEAVRLGVSPRADIRLRIACAA